MPLCGGLKPAEAPTPEVHDIVIQIKPAVEEKTGKSYAVFEAKQYASQVVAGINYFIKVHVGDNEHLHLRVYKNLQQELALHSLQEGKDEDDAIEYF